MYKPKAITAQNDITISSAIPIEFKTFMVIKLLFDNYCLLNEPLIINLRHNSANIQGHHILGFYPPPVHHR